MSDAAMPRACVMAALLIAFSLAGCQSTAPAKTDPAPVAAEPGPETVNAGQQTNQPAPEADKQTVEESGLAAETEQAKEPVQQAAVTPDAIPASADAELVFLDFAGFDEDLSREMGAERGTIAVDVPAAFSLNDVPDRLDRWFYRVKETGGEVQARQKLGEEERRTRGIVGVLLDLAVSAIEAQEAEEMLRPAEDYNVVVEYDKETGKADRVLFYRR